MYGTRVCTSADLIYMATAADKYEFNRRVETERLVEEIDPDGISVLECMVMYHRASFGPSREPIWPDHHRCYVYCKVRDQDAPATFFLDVEVSFWERLKTVEELKAAMDDPIAMGIASAVAEAREHPSDGDCASCEDGEHSSEEHLLDEDGKYVRSLCTCCGEETRGN